MNVALEAGASIVVAGSSVFSINERNIEGNVKRLREAF